MCAKMGKIFLFRWECCSGARAFPASRSLLTYFPQWLVLQRENCRSRELKGTLLAHYVNTETYQEILINNIHSVRCLLRMYARSQMHELFWNTRRLQMVSWSLLDSMLFGCCHGARNIFVPQKMLVLWLIPQRKSSFPIKRVLVTRFQ